MAAVEAQMADDAVLVADTGYAAAWAGALAEVRVAGRQFLRADGSLGWAFPAALGAQLAAPDKQVICVTGDGGFGYHVGELETAIRLQLPVVVIVLNNQTLAFEAHVQALLYGKVVPEVNDFHDVDYGKVARAFGANGFRVTTAAGFRRALAQGLEATRSHRHRRGHRSRGDRPGHALRPRPDSRAMTILAPTIDDPRNPGHRDGPTARRAMLQLGPLGSRRTSSGR